MIRSTRRRFLVLAGLAPAASCGAQLIGRREEWSVRGTDPVEIFHGERRLVSYRAGLDRGLPIFDPVVGPTGGAYTAPPDKGTEGKGDPRGGAWFSLGKVNGYNFHPSPGGPVAGIRTGRIVHRALNGVLIKGPAIVIRTKSEWRDGDDPTRRIASDQREITLYYREDGSLAMDLALELMADAGDLEIGPDPEGAWFVRAFPGLVRKEGGGKADPGTGAAGARAEWLVCQGTEAKGEAAGIAILDHPSNPGHPVAWTVRGDGILAANPFADPAAPPRVVPNGESIRFRYRTIFFRGPAAGIDLAKAHEAFAAR
ncbi:MAG: PmoA family protein [Verrucomicrobia bacterium]|nr:PmoA family protein [Verrucomicrobiota bacterium]